MLFVCKILIGTCLLGIVYAAGDEANATILQYSYENKGNGSYNYSFETSNGLKKEESGNEIPSIHDEASNAAFVKGSFSYTGADGVVYEVKYTADEAGFHPEGDHVKIPPFTPWIPGQPIDDGQYIADDTGRYKPDNSGKYTPEDDIPAAPEEVQENFISGERILSEYRTTCKPPTTVTEKYLPTVEPNYISGESILDTFLSARKPTESNTITPKYLPATSPQPLNPYFSGEGVLGDYQKYKRVTPNDLPPSVSYSRKQELSLSNDILKKAYFNKPTPHPDILLHSAPTERVMIIDESPLQKHVAAASERKSTSVTFTGLTSKAKAY